MPANIGSQIVSILFRTVANSGKWNQRALNVRSTGVYTGGWLAKVNNTTASISALVCEITDGLYQVRVSTAVTVNVSVPDSSTPYIVLRWTYGGTINDYMELLAVTTPATNDLIVGLCTFTGGGALDDFDYTDRSNPSTKDLFLKVEPTGIADSRVRIRGGYFQTSTSSVQILDQKSNVIGPPASNSQVYLVYVDAAGVVKIDSSGIPSASPSAPSYVGKLVLAEVTVSSTDVTITQDMIKDVRPFITNGQIAVDGSTLEINSSGQLRIKDAGVSYAKLGNVYDSGWFTCVPRQAYTKTHNLGGIALIVTLLFAPDSGGSPDLTKVTRVDATEEEVVDIGAVIQDITATQLIVASAYHYVACRIIGGGGFTGYASGHYRVLAMRVA